jgi:hypothetical protein
MTEPFLPLTKYTCLSLTDQPLVVRVKTISYASTLLILFLGPSASKMKSLPPYIARMVVFEAETY